MVDAGGKDKAGKTKWPGLLLDWVRVNLQPSTEDFVDYETLLARCQQHPDCPGIIVFHALPT